MPPVMFGVKNDTRIDSVPVGSNCIPGNAKEGNDFEPYVFSPVGIVHTPSLNKRLHPEDPGKQAVTNIVWSVDGFRPTNWHRKSDPIFLIVQLIGGDVPLTNASK